MPTSHPPKPRVHHLVQAPVKPLDEDGIVVGIIGTIGWIVVAIILGLNLGDNPSPEAQNWLWTAIAGILLGVVGVGYCALRKARRKKGNWKRN